MEASPSLAVCCFFVRMNLYFFIIRVLMVWVQVLPDFSAGFGDCLVLCTT